MKKNLNKIKYSLYHYENGKRIEGIHDRLYGNITELSGNVSELLIGNISGLSGNVSGLYGDASGLFGELDSCEITDEERAKGININDLVRD